MGRESVRLAGGDCHEEFTHAGIDCKIVRTEFGHWCGYVRRPFSVEPVQWRTNFASQHSELLTAEVDVWGGITYGPDETGWVGFDDAPSISLVSLADHRDEKPTQQAVKAETKRLATQVSEMMADRKTTGSTDDEKLLSL